ncbi:FkbM family methyltransferase [Roseomonas hellenica]|uniref:FkbM family methyltransferase n=1 Tax=Plastoroseomonas hellenica TaxID=2687306 RepID=A0ABS5F1W7_9PROT|nr:FkbM family methyltransferase [Plastoroseomonas hellenica]MBR0666560.1 FkbM family methyltransferase [Plastoroseomonas hellenica]
MDESTSLRKIARFFKTVIRSQKAESNGTENISLAEICEMNFKEYVANGRKFGPFVFDFLISDETGKSWYDSSPDQFMPERQWCLENVRPGFNILDCGAHHGMMTVLFSLMTGKTGQVHAWEALPANAEVVRRNAALNNCTNVLVHPRAVGSGDATLPYHRNSGNVVLVAGSDRSSTDHIQVVALDDDVDPSLRVDFVKMDVEGSDLEALQGARRILTQRPVIDLEIHNFLFADRVSTLSAIFEILNQHDYSYEVLPNIFDPIMRIDGHVDVSWLASFDNPHVFCSPH